MNVLAIDIGGTKFSLAAFEAGKLRLQSTQSTDRSAGPRYMVGRIAQIVADWRVEHEFVPDACGVGFGGPINFATQRVVLSTHVEGWVDFPLIETLKSLFGTPIIMDNDAIAGALGESFYGAGIGCSSLFYMTLSTGIGGGVVIDGQVYRGADSYAGELGHINLEPNGPDCLCGSNGCFERMCCGLWLERDFGRPATDLLLDEAFVDRYVVLLARGLKAALMMLNPSRIVIGGGMAKAGDRLFIPLRRELNRQMTSWSKARRDVVPAALGDASVLYGALVLAQSIQKL